MKRIEFMEKMRNIGYCVEVNYDFVNEPPIKVQGINIDWELKQLT